MLMLDRILAHYFGDMKDIIMMMGITHKVPTNRDVEFAAMVAALMLLHINEVPMDTDFPDLVELKSDILKLLSSIEDLKSSMSDYKERHNALAVLRDRSKGKL